MELSKDYYKIKLIGKYLACSHGAIQMAVERQEQQLKNDQTPDLIGQLLLADNIISEEELNIGLRKQRADRLLECPVFQELQATELAGIGNKFYEVSIPAGETFIKKGENDPFLYVISSGKVEVFITNDQGKDIHIAYVEAFEPIGEMGYFQGGIRTASIRAVERTHLLKAPYSGLTHYFEHVPKVAHAFIDMMNRRQAENEAKLKK